MAAQRDGVNERNFKIMKEARRRFKACQDWELQARTHFRDDLKFAEGDAYNQYQWPKDVLNQRLKRPTLTINRVRQHNLDILNDARQSKIDIKVRPLRSGASYEAAQLFEGIIDHIEYISDAETAYQQALKFAVQGGIGWVRIATDYAGDDSFDQECFIRPINDSLSVYLDPDIKMQDGSDAMYGFVFTDMPKAEFDEQYPDLKDTAADSELGPAESWVMGEKVRIAEYFRAVRDEEKLVSFVDPTTGERVIKKEKEVDKALLEQVIDSPDFAERAVVKTKIEHFEIIGDRINEEKTWLGAYIPLLRCIGEETVIDGIMDRKGHTRALIDPQRMFNYNASGAVEYGALQSKIPYIAAVAAIEGNERYWNSANTENHSVLPYKHIDDDGKEIPMPQRQQPPTAAPVYMQGMRDAMEQMYLASGQNQADFGQPGNEKSGVAIQQRQRQGDNATYHYLANQALMIRFAGKQLLDLIPKVYDTERMVKMQDEAGNETEIKIDPEAPQAYQKIKSEDGHEVVVLNPKLGVYDVQADVGPAYATRRQEAFVAFSNLLAANKELVGVVGDIWMRFSDVPGGQEAAERLKRMVPKQALEDGPAPDLVAAQQQLEQLQGIVTSLEQKLADKSATHLNDQESNAIEAYRAQSDRLGKIGAVKDFLAVPGAAEILLKFFGEVIAEAEQTSGAGLGPALTPDAEIRAEDVAPVAPPQLATPEAVPAPEAAPAPAMAGAVG